MRARTLVSPELDLAGCPPSSSEDDLRKLFEEHGKVEEVFHGAEGMLSMRSGGAEITGKNAWKFSGGQRDPYTQEHIDLQNAILKDLALNEAEQVAKSTMCAIMGRMAAYTGKDLSWDEAINSKEVLMPESIEFGSRPEAPVAIPGKTKFV